METSWYNSGHSNWALHIQLWDGRANCLVLRQVFMGRVFIGLDHDVHPDIQWNVFHKKSIIIPWSDLQELWVYAELVTQITITHGIWEKKVGMNPYCSKCDIFRVSFHVTHYITIFWKIVAKWSFQVNRIIHSPTIIWWFKGNMVGSPKQRTLHPVFLTTTHYFSFNWSMPVHFSFSWYILAKGLLGSGKIFAL